jgi:hypothetical protein
MLSPNATNRVAVNRGGLVMVTVNVHEEDFLFASTAEQVTLVVPSGNVAPATGLHETVTGAVPPLKTGFG